MKTYLGLDISLNSTGVALLNEDFSLNKYFAITPSSSDKTVFEKQRSQFGVILELIKSSNIEVAFIENLSFGSFKFSNAISPIVETTGILKFLINSNNIPIVLYAPSTVKKVITGSGRADKKMVRTSVLSMYQELSDSLPFDIYDAISVCVTGMRGLANND